VAKAATHPDLSVGIKENLPKRAVFVRQWQKIQEVLFQSMSAAETSSVGRWDARDGRSRGP
jgi:hypothetical protein